MALVRLIWRVLPNSQAFPLTTNLVFLLMTSGNSPRWPSSLLISYQSYLITTRRSCTLNFRRPSSFFHPARAIVRRSEVVPMVSMIETSCPPIGCRSYQANHSIYRSCFPRAFYHHQFSTICVIRVQGFMPGVVATRFLRRKVHIALPIPSCTPWTSTQK